MTAIAQYFSAHGADYRAAALGHIAISAAAVLAAAAVGVPLGVLAARSRLAGVLTTGVFSALRAAPSLAVLLLCIPLMGTGAGPAVAALAALAVPPILVNTLLAFRALPPPVLETALGLGMGRCRTFARVKLPLALPLMLAGLRTAVVEVIASATLAAYIGAGGLGAIIFTGLGLMRTDLLLIGGVSVAALSLASGFLLSRLEHWAVRYAKTS